MPPPRRSERAAETRARILAETIAVLEAGGDDAVKVLEIAAAAHVSTGSIYHHFEGRDGLIIAARLQQFRAAVPEDILAIDTAIDHSPDVVAFRAAMVEVARLAHSDARADNRRTRAEVIAAAHMHPALAEALAAEQHHFTATVAQAIERGQDRGLIDPTLPSAAVAVLFMGIAFGRLLCDIDHDPVDDASWLTVIRRMIDDVLTAHAPR